MTETREAIVWTIRFTPANGSSVSAWRAAVVSSDPVEAMRLATARNTYTIPGVWQIDCEPAITSAVSPTPPQGGEDER